MKQLKIGKIRLKNRLFLAPMVEVTDLAYREICRKVGASIAYTEMLHVNAILSENTQTKRLMKTNSKDKPTGIQITGSNIEDFRKVIPYLKKYDLIDINCGCPSSRITDNDSGSALLKDPEKISSIIRLLKSHGLTVTAKIRLGFAANEAVKIAKTIEDSGADAITVHARLANQRNSVPADWNAIKRVKQNVKIPVIGNGDVFTGKDAEEMLKICDGCMIARAAIGDPYIFTRIVKYLKTGREKQFDFRKNIMAFIMYLKLAKRYDIINMNRIKYLGVSFLRNAKGAAKMRSEFMKCKSYDDCVSFFSNLLRNIH